MLGSDRSVRPDDWAAIEHRDLKQCGGGNLVQLVCISSQLAAPASYYFTYIVVATKVKNLNVEIQAVIENLLFFFVRSQKSWV